ncbi:hypothetical protein FAIPA1_60141 [Frankia sp. AiPs1]
MAGDSDRTRDSIVTDLAGVGTAAEAAGHSRNAGNVWSFPYACEVSCRVRTGKSGHPYTDGLTPRAAHHAAAQRNLVPPLLPN